MTRTRTNAGPPYPAGSVTNSITGVQYFSTVSALPSYYDTCEDVPGTADGQFLEVVHFSKNPSPCYLTGIGKWSNVSNFYQTGAVLESKSVWSFVTDPSTTTVATKTVAGTNPSRPVADVPVMIFELRETLGLIKALGIKSINLLKEKKLLGKVAEANLIYQFELVPLASDVATILDFSEQVDKRVRELERMRDKGGLSKVYRKKTPYYSAGSGFDSSYNLNSGSNGPGLSTTRLVKANRETWGFAKWQISSNQLFPQDAASLRALARKAVYGLTIDTLTAWELIPWSWLIDYVVDVGSYLSTNRNMVPCFCSQVFVCRHTTIEVSYGPSKDANLRCDAWKATTESKTRTLAGFTAPTAHLPFLNYGQMSIIASLGVLKSR